MPEGMIKLDKLWWRRLVLVNISVIAFYFIGMLLFHLFGEQGKGEIIIEIIFLIIITAVMLWS